MENKSFHVDKTVLRNLLVEKIALDRELYDRLLELAEEMIDEFRQRAFTGSTENLKILSSICHKMKSSFSSLGLTRLEQYLNNLDDACKTRNPNEARAAYLGFLSSAPEAMAELRRLSKEILEEAAPPMSG